MKSRITKIKEWVKCRVGGKCTDEVKSLHLVRVGKGVQMWEVYTCPYCKGGLVTASELGNLQAGVVASARISSEAAATVGDDIQDGKVGFVAGGFGKC